MVPSGFLLCAAAGAADRAVATTAAVATATARAPTRVNLIFRRPFRYGVAAAVPPPRTSLGLNPVDAADPRFLPEPGLGLTGHRVTLTVIGEPADLVTVPEPLYVAVIR
ncbi:hypothetical protein Axi01nite_50360 [Actinoplanes xinjiangensis]|nr:hypothetical protein Axi01nite_50360 [Actinoplanes xinjiangensis]